MYLTAYYQSGVKYVKLYIIVSVNFHSRFTFVLMVFFFLNYSNIKNTIINLIDFNFISNKILRPTVDKLLNDKNDFFFLNNDEVRSLVLMCKMGGRNG